MTYEKNTIVDGITILFIDTYDYPQTTEKKIELRKGCSASSVPTTGGSDRYPGMGLRGSELQSLSSPSPARVGTQHRGPPYGQKGGLQHCTSSKKKKKGTRFYLLLLRTPLPRQSRPSLRASARRWSKNKKGARFGERLS